ncbi:uncharacterized protein MELLADRAFT_68343 [Melampsora larici-populina 98AG31]|uniref:Uncharacterized protein n=1 Tax=Melampsora larici-populina (strain 98AG31 / pathotype 3-4-7) TaxID=747676 RepID=F4S6G1_MELLP|nr:uncharacterized protein MELLADRAFT_68343 [Melampsora larici-populina 98AG31]EGF99767.1 hypothetical protein MELLADRAFT_68343 [Melampsora larici-populina 98AG31]
MAENSLINSSTDWNSSATTPFPASIQIRNLTSIQDQVVRECERLCESQQSTSNIYSIQCMSFEEKISLLMNQLNNLDQENCTLKQGIQIDISTKFEEKIHPLANQLNNLTEENVTLSKVIQADVQTVEGLCQRIDYLEGVNHFFEAEVKAKVQSVDQILVCTVLTFMLFSRVQNFELLLLLIINALALVLFIASKISELITKGYYTIGKLYNNFYYLVLTTSLLLILN